MASIAPTDIFIISAYFLIIINIGYWAARREKNESSGYFLAGRDVGRLSVGALFTSNIGSNRVLFRIPVGSIISICPSPANWE